MMLNKKFKEKNFRQFYYGSQSIKIDVIQKRFSKFSRRKSLNKQNKSKDYYTCDKLEHFFENVFRTSTKINHDYTIIMIKLLREQKLSL